MDHEPSTSSGTATSVTVPTVMRAWESTGRPGPDRLRLVERPVPQPGVAEVLVRVDACGVCRTDLHVTDRDLPEHRPHVVPGHEVIGEVVGLGSGVRRFELGDRVGIAWLRGTCGQCRWCRTGAENLCPEAVFTGWDADGGYAEYAVAPAAYVYDVPEDLSAPQAAPLLCAGIIGYRALSRANLPPGGRLGLYGFGASAHLTAQVAIAQGAEVHVLTRGEESRQLALDLGAASAGPADGLPPVPLDSSILFAPVGDLVPVALEGLDRGGTLAIAGIHLTGADGDVGDGQHPGRRGGAPEAGRGARRALARDEVRLRGRRPCARRPRRGSGDRRRGARHGMSDPPPPVVRGAAVASSPAC
jgi:propanol-preferring alcohol dehydrogenase